MLCRTIAYKRRNGIGIVGLGKYKDKNLAKLATEYLDSIEGDLIEHIEQMDGFFSKSDCPIQKTAWELHPVVTNCYNKLL